MSLDCLNASKTDAWVPSPRKPPIKSGLRRKAELPRVDRQIMELAAFGEPEHEMKIRRTRPEVFIERMHNAIPSGRIELRGFFT